MSTRNETHVHDLSTFANFKDWASAIGAALGAFGWNQSSDTGQVVWTATVLTLTQVAVGANAVYSYSSFTGPAPRVGMSVIITGFANGGNNLTATLTAVSGGASGTVTVALTTQVNETHAGSGTTTANSTVPTSGNSVYEIWQPGDGLTAFFVRIDYANSGGSSPQLKVQIGTTTNGSGTLTGTTLTQIISTTTTNSGATLFNCLFCGTSGSFECVMWRDAGAAFNLAFGIERSKDSSGNDTSTYVSLYGLGFGSSSANDGTQQHLVFGTGATTFWLAAAPRLLMTLDPSPGGANSGAFNGNTALSPVFPRIGYFDNPSLCFQFAVAIDYSENSTITTTIYGASHTYVFTKNQNLAVGVTSSLGLLLRFE
jgi:hypothetical protein